MKNLKIAIKESSLPINLGIFEECVLDPKCAVISVTRCAIKCATGCWIAGEFSPQV